MMTSTVREARTRIMERWYGTIASYQKIYADGRMSGTSPPSVFVGSAGYPHVLAGPMMRPGSKNTSAYDSPEKWSGTSLQDIIAYRTELVRGVKAVSADHTSSRYVTQLQDIAMGSRPAQGEITFDGKMGAAQIVDGCSAPFGPMANIMESNFANISAHHQISKCYYDTDMGAADAVLRLYDLGTEISRIQRCFSVGMFGKERHLVPTKWSITATDDIISKKMISNILDYPLLDSYRVFGFAHLGNSYSAILLPKRWAFGFAEVWNADGKLVFGSDCEDAGGFHGQPNTAGAYYAARLAAAEYLYKLQRQATAVVLREISPDYVMPVGVWQVREGVRAAMRAGPSYPDSLQDAIDTASGQLTISKNEWLRLRHIYRTIFQSSITDF